MTKLIRHHGFRLWLIGAAIALVAFSFLVNLHLSLGSQKFILSPDSIRHDLGCAYVVGPIKERPPGWPLTHFLGDSKSQPTVSTLSLFENGVSIGNAHSLHDKIRDSESAGYSHWGNFLYFSTGDCSDPRINGKSYEVVVTPKLTWLAKVLVLLSAFFIVFSMHRALYNDPRYVKLRGLANRIILAGISPAPLRSQGTAGFLILLGLLASAGTILVFNWTTGRSVGLAVSGIYQVSDASAYWWCANALIDLGNFGSPLITGEWCQRRPIYPNFLAGLSWIANQSIVITLLLQALMICLAIFVLTRRVTALIGVFSGVIFTVVLFVYAASEALPFTMTEALGVILGSLGVAILLIAAERKSALVAAIGIFTLSTAMNTRAGAFGVLPLLVCWAGLVALILKESFSRWLIFSSVAVLGGFLVQTALILIIGGNPSSSHGNFAYTLYGLTVGGKGWSQVLIDYPNLPTLDSLKSKAIYEIAFKNLVSSPELLALGILKNVNLLFENGTFGFDKFGTLGPIVQIFWWVAWIPMILNRKNPAYLLILLCSIGIFLSAPIIYIDGGPRLFAATAAIDSIQIAIGSAFIISVLAKGVNWSLVALPVVSEAGKQSSVRWERGAFFIIATTLVVPHFVPHSLSRVTLSSTPVCSASDQRVITKIGGGPTLLLDIIPPNGSPDFLKGRIPRDLLIAGIPHSAWWRGDLINFSGKSLMLAYQYDMTDPSAPGPLAIFSDLSLSSFRNKTVWMCVSNSDKIKIFDVEYKKLLSLSEIKGLSEYIR